MDRTLAAKIDASNIKDLQLLLQPLRGPMLFLVGLLCLSGRKTRSITTRSPALEGPTDSGSTNTEFNSMAPGTEIIRHRLRTIGVVRINCGHSHLMCRNLPAQAQSMAHAPRRCIWEMRHI